MGNVLHIESFSSQNAPVTLLTTSKKRMKNVCVSVKVESDDGEEEESDKDNEVTREQIMGRGKRTAVLDSKLRVCLHVVFTPFSIVDHFDPTWELNSFFQIGSNVLLIILRWK